MSIETPTGRSYCLVTPCRDEARYIAKTLDAVVGQTARPAAWVIVDDGSTDATPEILAEYASRHDFIHVVRREDRGRRSVGPGVIDAFYAGLAQVELDAYDYVCKLDGDLEFGPEYFERLMCLMEADPWLGNLSGKLFGPRASGTLIEERTGDEDAVGPAKFYRVKCFQDIGGFVRELAWDGIDGHMCRMRGWIARSVDDPRLRIIHHRPMGSSDRNQWIGRLRWGRGKYVMGSSWYYVFAASVYRLFERPWLLGGVGIAAGYVGAALRRCHRYGDASYRRYLRQYEAESLFRGRRRTLAKYDANIRRRWQRGPGFRVPERPFNIDTSRRERMTEAR
jgi:glycosyltransferase involved in cell wall biosynthesis